MYMLHATGFPYKNGKEMINGVEGDDNVCENLEALRVLTGQSLDHDTNVFL